ncbi:hypothetical protein ABTX81_30485 [Kitasatospora sp. NPDC097605]|uniref:hypothetical protein n=1 Tax=Kitasatospora sp. NPDC097605 TaxID=3157226 RepID=UPI0033255EA8
MPHAVIVHRPGEYRDIRIGPIRYKSTTTEIAHRLARFMPTTPHLPGTTLSTGPYDAKLPHLPLLPDDPGRLAAMMDDQPGEGTDEAFPSLFDRAQAQFTIAELGPLWDAALAAYDARHSTGNDQDRAPDAPLTTTWTGLTTTLPGPGTPIVVDLVLADGRRAELHLDDEHREALGLALVDPGQVENDNPRPARTGRRRGTAPSRLALRRRTP